MDTVYLALAEHQWEFVTVIGSLACFVLGWSVFGWAK